MGAIAFLITAELSVPLLALLWLLHTKNIPRMAYTFLTISIASLATGIAALAISFAVGVFADISNDTCVRFNMIVISFERGCQNKDKNEVAIKKTDKEFKGMDQKNTDPKRNHRR